MSVVDAVPVEAAIEVNADCADRARAEATLAASLAAARGPRRSSDAGARWRLEMQVVTAAPGIKAADARIVDDAGRLVAERSVSDKTTGSCVALVRAVSAWAQIVLDDELVRAHDSDAQRVEPAPPRPEHTSTSSSVTLASAHVPIDADSGPKESGLAPRLPVDVGTTLFLRNGVASTGGIFGASPFVTIGLSRTLLLRPALVVGTSTSRVPPDESRSANLTAFGARVDVCKRLPGNYIERRGIELDACAGTDVAWVASELVSAMRASLGPSAVLRGELGESFGLEIRGMVGANLLRGGLGADAPFFVAAAELGGSVRFR